MYQRIVNSVFDATSPKNDLGIALAAFEGDDASLVSILEARYDLDGPPSHIPSQASQQVV